MLQVHYTTLHCFAGQYSRCYGNLRRDGVEEVLSHALADGPCSYDEIWFTKEQLLPVHKLAARFSHPDSLRIKPLDIFYRS